MYDRLITTCCSPLPPQYHHHQYIPPWTTNNEQAQGIFLVCSFFFLFFLILLTTIYSQVPLTTPYHHLLPPHEHATKQMKMAQTTVYCHLGHRYPFFFSLLILSLLLTLYFQLLYSKLRCVAATSHPLATTTTMMGQAWTI